MIFADPQKLHLLWILPLLAWLFHLAYARREAITARFIQTELLPQASRTFTRRRWRLKAVIFLAFFTCAVLALARPQWGYRWQEAKMQSLDILIAVDVSKSMLTQDVRPNRLERTKLAVQDLIKKLSGDRVGIIAFAGQSFLTCPLTNDYNGFLLSLNDLGPETIPRGGTDLSSAIDEAIKAYGALKQPNKILVLITDGEDQQGDAQAAAKRAKDKGIKIYTVGIGTQEGDLVRAIDNEGKEDFLKDAEGNYIKSRLNENLLQQVAYVTGGAYVRSSGAQFGLDYLYDRQLAGLQKQDIENKMEKKYTERFQWLVALALVFLFMETAVITWKPKV